MTTLQWIGEILGGIAILENIFIFLSLKRENLLKLRCLSDLLWVSSFVCLGGYSAAVLNAIDAVATVVYAERGRRAGFDRVWIPCLFILGSLSSPIAEWIVGGFSFRPLLCAAGSTLMLIALWQEKPDRTRYIAIFSDVLWLIYSWLVPSVSGVVCNVVLIVSTVVGIFRSYRTKKKAGMRTEKEEAKEVQRRAHP